MGAAVVVVPGTGILLNDQLTDGDGSSSGAATEAAPSKRRRSSMSPTIARDGGPTVSERGDDDGVPVVDPTLHRPGRQDAASEPRMPQIEHGAAAG